MKIKWGTYLWKLRLLLFMPYLIFGIWAWSTIGNDAFPMYYWISLTGYMLICTVILHIMDKKAKKEKE
ncbi:hypothetical protein UP17_16315 [Peribacillus simplex]|uniref:hypothetical protein n=1 Tax=Peribacillus simplex TaxID=1478 RepID=UPI000777D45E|nr:hypothetical protein [Peribacillus simplex]AMM93846.1 hypothetical protein UP17_16315 [Peribacillus simplex]